MLHHTAEENKKMVNQCLLLRVSVDFLRLRAHIQVYILGHEVQECRESCLENQASRYLCLRKFLDSDHLMNQGCKKPAQDAVDLKIQFQAFI